MGSFDGGVASSEKKKGRNRAVFGPPPIQMSPSCWRPKATVPPLRIVAGKCGMAGVGRVLRKSDTEGACEALGVRACAQETRPPHRPARPRMSSGGRTRSLILLKDDSVGKRGSTPIQLLSPTPLPPPSTNTHLTSYLTTSQPPLPTKRTTRRLLSTQPSAHLLLLLLLHPHPSPP